jgi:hypothetical protein
VPYLGGPLLANVEVVPVFWDPTVDTTVQAQIAPFYSTLIHSAFIDFLQQYDVPGFTIGSGTVKPPVILMTTGGTSPVDDTAIGDAIAIAIGNNRLPAPNANTLYMVHMPPGVVVTADTFTSCIDFCGYHSYFAGSHVSFAYGVLPDFGASGSCFGGCGDVSAFDDFTKTAAHEVMESITDPQGSGWLNSSLGEIADLCNYSVIGNASYAPVTDPSTGITYQAQEGFSNSLYETGGGVPPGSGCQGFTPAPPPPATPALGSGATLGLAALLAAMGVLALRRQRLEVTEDRRRARLLH